MQKQFPPTITVPCYNKECSNLIHLSLYEGYYKNREYSGECTRCAIHIRINKLSPFLENVSNYGEINMEPSRFNRMSKPMKGDL